MEKPIFILFTSETCPHSKKFIRDDLAHLKQELEKEGKLDFLHLVYGKSDYPKELSGILGSVPSFIVVNSTSWKKGEIKGEVYGKHYDSNNNLVDDAYIKPPTVINLINWANEMIKSPMVTGM